jgi:WD40 repeat protein
VTGRSERGPYQGLVPYTEDDAAYFFGRDTARDIVLDNLLAYRVSILYGSSGVGKTSLLRAGVVRHVRDESRRLIEHGEPAGHAAVIFSAWSEDPVAGVREAIRGALEQVSPSLAADLPGDSLADAVIGAAERLDGSLLIILDQFEEYFLYHPPDGPFVKQLARTVARRDAPASVLISIREDALARLDALAGDLPGLLDNLVRIEHLDRGAARAAITEPLELWNSREAQTGHEVRIEQALVEAVLDGVEATSLAAGEFDGAGGDAGRGTDTGIQTPYLQLVLMRLWEEEQRAGSRLLRLQTLDRLQGAEQIVATHVDTAMARLSSAEQAVAARVLRHLVTPSGTKIALRTADLAEYADLDEPAVMAVLERLTREARILQAIGDSRYEIYHDALARPILDWRRRWQGEQERADQRRRNRAVAAIVGGLLLTVIVVAALAVLALDGRRDARRQAADATSVALASAAGDQLATQPDVSLLLALAALREKDRPEARTSMVAAREAAGPGDAVGILRGHTGAVNGVTFVRRRRAIVSAGADGKVIVWDPATHRRLGRPFATAATAFTCLAVSPDGRTLAAGAEDGKVRLWDFATRHRTGTLAGSRQAVLSVAFSLDGRLLASAGEEHRIRLWNVPARKPLAPALVVPDRRTNRVAFSPDGRTLASAGSVSGVRLWSVTSRRALRRTPGGGAPVTSLAFSPDGQTLAIAGAGTSLWSLRSGRKRPLRATGAGQEQRSAGGGIGDLAFSPDGRRLAGAGDDGGIRLWDVPTRRLLRLIRGPAKLLNSVAFSPDGRTLAAAGADRRIWLMHPAIGRVASQEDAVNAVAFDRTGRVLATADYHGRIRLWDTGSGRALGSPLMGTAPFNAVAFDPRGRMLASGGDNGRVLLWDLRTHRVTGPPLAGHIDAVNGVAFSPDGSLLASGANGSAIIIWDVRSHRPLRDPFGRDGGDISAVTFSPDGRVLASAGSDGRVRLWDVRTHRPLGRVLVRHADMVNSVAFSGDGATLASAASDGTIRLTDVRSRRPRGSLSAGDAAVLSIAFTPDGRTLITGAEDGRIRLWDVASRRLLGRTLTEHTAAVNAVAASTDGQTFASGSSDHTRRIWSRIIWSDDERLAAEICDLVGSDLSRDEWTQLATGIHYRPVCDA